MKMRKTFKWKIFFSLLLIIAGSRSAYAQLPYQHKPAHYWIATKTGQEIYDDQVIQLMGNTATVSVIHPRSVDYYNNDSFSLQKIMARFRRVAPSLPLLMYTWTTAGTPVPSTYSFPQNLYFPFNYMSATDSPLNFNYIGDTLIHYPAGGGLYTSADGYIFGDLTAPPNTNLSKYYSGWITRKILDTMRHYGFDGVMSDIFHAAPFLSLQPICPMGTGTVTGSFCKSYYNSVLQFIANIRDSMAGGKFVFNGLIRPAPYYSDTEQLYAALHSDGANVEFFGYADFNKDSAGADQIIPYIQDMSEHQSAHILVNGRGIDHNYVGYAEDLAWERYVFASYLLGKNNNTAFHYFVDFLLPHTSGGRSTQLDYYEDMKAIDSLGDAVMSGGVDTYSHIANGIYTRKFTNGYVYVHPFGVSGSGVFTLPSGTFYTLDSVNHFGPTGSYTLAPCQALILLTKKLDSVHHIVTKNFDSPTEPTSTWENCSTIHESTAPFYYDSLSGLPASSHHLHDLMLDWTRGDSNWHTMQIQIRGTGDVAAAFYVVADVEDTSKQFMQLVFYDSLNNHVSIALPHKDTIPLFRQYQPTTGNRDSVRTYFIPIKQKISPIWDSGWQNITIDADAILANTSLTGYTIRRLAFMRAIGSMDIANIRLPYAPSASASLSSAAICAGGTSTLTATAGFGVPPFSYLWSPATSLSASTGANVTASPATTTTYTLTIRDANGFMGANTATLTVNPTPVASVYSTSPTSLCSGSSSISLTYANGAGSFIDYMWNGSDGSSGTTATSVITATPTITTTYSVTVNTSAPGCTGTAAATTTVTVAAQPSLTFTLSPTAICVNGTTSVNGMAGGGVPGTQSYGWSGPGIGTVFFSVPAPTSFTPSVTATSGIYTVTYSSSGQGCTTATATNTLTVNALPVASISSTIPSALCSGNTTITPAYSGGGGSFVNYVWASSDGSFATTSTAAVTLTPTATTTYSVTVNTSAPGCTGIAAATTTVTKASQPSLTFTFTPTHIIVNGTTTITGTATGGVAGTQFYKWAGPGIASVINSPTPPASFTPTVIATPGSYTIAFCSTGQGCIQATTTHTLTVTSHSPHTVTTSIDNNTQPGTSFNWELYPNPTKDVVNITATTLVKEDLRFELNDVAGRTLKTTSLMLSGTQIVSLKVSELPAGTYFISVYRNNIMYETKKLVLIK